MINKYLVSFLCLIIGLIGIHFLKNKTRELEQQIEKISKNLNILRENLEIEKVEFSFLSSPIRISELAKKHLPNDYKPIVPKEITNNEK
jgi:hypothetical protein